MPEAVRYITYHGSKRYEVVQNLDDYDVVLTTYDTLRSDQAKGDQAKGGPLFEKEWTRIILDEGFGP
jgi:SWI/SNF-related matrix-associated actin-dependent regulator of chromatin subfamily A3